MVTKSDSYDLETRTPWEEAVRIVGSHVVLASFAKRYRTVFDWKEFGVPAREMHKIRLESQRAQALRQLLPRLVSHHSEGPPKDPMLASLVQECVEGILRLEQLEEVSSFRILLAAIRAAVEQAEKGHVTDKEGPQKEGGGD